MQAIKVNNSYEIPDNFTGIAEWADESKHWYKEGKLHREGGPAREWADGTKEWWVEGKKHRIDGPAVEWADGTKSWWVEGKPYYQLILKN